MPEPTADHARLAGIAGSWRGTETMHPSPWDPRGGQAQAATHARMALDGFALIVDYEQSRGGQRTYAGHGVYTIDRETRQVVLHWWDSLGGPVDEFRGAWSGSRLQLVSRNVMGHWRLTYDIGEGGAMTSRMETSSDGVAWQAMFDGSYTRQG